MKECKCSSCTCSKNEGKIKVSLERFKNSFQVEFIDENSDVLKSFTFSKEEMVNGLMQEVLIKTIDKIILPDKIIDSFYQSNCRIAVNGIYVLDIEEELGVINEDIENDITFMDAVDKVKKPNLEKFEDYFIVEFVDTESDTIRSFIFSKEEADNGFMQDVLTENIEKIIYPDKIIDSLHGLTCIIYVNGILVNNVEKDLGVKIGDRKKELDMTSG